MSAEKKQKRNGDSTVRDFEAEEQINRALRARRRAELRRRRRRKAKIKRALVLAGTGLCLLLIITGSVSLVKNAVNRNAEAAESGEAGGVSQAEAKGGAGIISGPLAAADEIRSAVQELQTAGTSQGDAQANAVAASSAAAGTADYSISGQDSAAALASGEVMSTRALLVDWDTRTVVAQRGAAERINPASMTKILTLLVAAEHVTDLDDTFTITREITD